ncbi:MAG: tyrosine-protein phosphatase [Planctomycetota bacterium]|nr:tyrosine-protein phosphatase [Planctomycetota bacterium]
MSTDVTSAPTAATQRKIRWILGIAMLLGLAGGLFYYIDQYWPWWHFRTVETQKFYRSSQLGEKELTEAIERYGIKTVINLRDVSEREHGDWYSMEVKVAERNGAKVLDIPLKAGTPPSPEQVRTILEVLDDAANLPVLAHCYHGTIRSAAAEGLFRCEYLGESGPVAFSRVETWGRDLEEDYPLIADFIKQYVPRRDRPSDPASKDELPKDTPAKDTPAK